MAKSQKMLIFSWFYRQNCRPGNFSFDALLTEAVTATLDTSRTNPEAFVQHNAKRYWNWLLEQQQTDVGNGITPIFWIRDRSFRAVQWWAFTFNPNISKKEQRKKIAMQARPNILRRIDLLTDTKYEALGCFASDYSGASDTVLTPRGNEGGIDFFAKIMIPGRAHVFQGENGPLRIVGQSKKYTSPVSGEKAQLLISSINDVKHNYHTVSKVTPSWFRATKGPIAGWLIAHSGFQSGCLTRAKDHGIFTSDSIDLAEIFCGSHHMPIDRSAEYRANYFTSVFTDYCNSHFPKL